MPNWGELIDAQQILSRVGLYGPQGMDIGPIQAGPVMDYLTGTGGISSPYELEVALVASAAYVAEYRRSNGKSTDAPWEWPKTERDLAIFEKVQERAIAALMGE